MHASRCVALGGLSEAQFVGSAVALRVVRSARGGGRQLWLGGAHMRDEPSTCWKFCHSSGAHARSGPPGVPRSSAERLGGQRWTWALLLSLCESERAQAPRRSAESRVTASGGEQALRSEGGRSRGAWFGRRGDRAQGCTWALSCSLSGHA